MALQTSGAISLSDINVELNLSATATISLNDSAVRGLFGKPSGVISLSDGYGKANEIVYINTSNRTVASIFELMGSPTQPGIYVFENQATISAGASSYALRTGVFPVGSTLRIVNKGYIRGRGGAGGDNAGGAGAAAGAALYVDMDCILDTETGFILGGGGGGGGARQLASNGVTAYYDIRVGGGGGAGSSPGTAGPANVQGSTGELYVNTNATAGSESAGGAGGHLRKGVAGGRWEEAIGGSGGPPGTAGLAGVVYDNADINMKTLLYTGAGGAAGAAILRNGKVVTITAGNNTTQIKGAIV